MTGGDFTILPEDEVERVFGLPILPLPLTFAGGITIDSIDVNCPGCGAQLPSTDIRGSWHVNDHSVALDAIGICWQCNSIGPLPPARYRADGTSLEMQADGSWRECRWGLKTASPLEIIKRRIQQRIKAAIKR